MDRPILVALCFTSPYYQQSFNVFSVSKFITSQLVGLFLASNIKSLDIDVQDICSHTLIYIYIVTCGQIYEYIATYAFVAQFDK